MRRRDRDQLQPDWRAIGVEEQAARTPSTWPLAEQAGWMASADGMAPGPDDAGRGRVNIDVRRRRRAQATSTACCCRRDGHPASSSSLDADPPAQGAGGSLIVQPFTLTNLPRRDARSAAHPGGGRRRQGWLQRLLPQAAPMPGGVRLARVCRRRRPSPRRYLPRRLPPPQRHCDRRADAPRRPRSCDRPHVHALNRQTARRRHRHADCYA